MHESIDIHLAVDVSLRTPRVKDLVKFESMRCCLTTEFIDCKILRFWYQSDRFVDVIDLHQFFRVTVFIIN